MGNEKGLNHLIEFAENLKENKDKEKDINVSENINRLAELASVTEAAREVTIKTYNDSFLYHKGDYEKNIMEFLMRGEEIDKNHPSFENIIYMLKRNPYPFLTNIIISDRIILLRKLPKSMPRSFKVFAGKDIRKGTSELKVFIDVTGVITDNGGEYSLSANKVNELISYLTSAMVYCIYHIDPIRLIGNTKLVESGTSCFALLFTHIIDYLRVGGVENVRGKTLYLSSLYYQIGILNVRMTDSVRNRALKISKLTSKEADMVDFQISKDSFKDINEFINTIALVLRVPELKIDNFIDKWVFLYKSGTQFATEYYPAFSSMLTNAYHGAYINNQNTIEKVTNNGKDLVEYCRALLQIGREMF